MNKRTRNIVLIVVGFFVLVFFYGMYNFEDDKQDLLEIKAIAAQGNVRLALEKIEEQSGFANPLIALAFYRWKKKMYDRFVNQEEKIENTSGNEIVQDISNIYRDYWRTELLKDKTIERTDSLLYENLANYLLSNQLISTHRDSLMKTIRNDEELGMVLEKQGYQSIFLYRNGFQDLLIWDEETTDSYEVNLPKDTIQIKVVFIEGYYLKGYSDFATLGSAQIGGWASKKESTLFCSKGEYDLDSEEFKQSYLKHESLHFTDFKKYPKLNSANLEYRAKLIELMYCTEATIYDRIEEFTSGASSENRTHAHPYANYCIIRDFSKLIFKSRFEENHDNWKNISVEKINSAATTLYNWNEEKLMRNRLAIDVI